MVREGVDLMGAGVTSNQRRMGVECPRKPHGHGETPVVDVRSARQTRSWPASVRSLPASRSYGNYLAAIPAIQPTGFNGVQMTNNSFTARGGRSNESAIQIEGMIVGSPFTGGGLSLTTRYDVNNSIEVQVSISGGPRGILTGAAPTLNIIPKGGRQHVQRGLLRELRRQSGQLSNIDDVAAGASVSSRRRPF